MGRVWWLQANKSLRMNGEGGSQIKGVRGKGRFERHCGARVLEVGGRLERPLRFLDGALGDRCALSAQMENKGGGRKGQKEEKEGKEKAAVASLREAPGFVVCRIVCRAVLTSCSYPHTQKGAH